MRRKHFAFWLACALAGTYLLMTSFRRGWTHTETDFPNYYTAAALTLHHQPLRNFYNWTWFQRQIDRVGIEPQLGGYIPHTPLTMLPILPLAALSPQHAKQVWLILGVLFLIATVWILSRLTGFAFVEVLFVALLAQSALASNLVLGQYYLFLLFLLALSAWCAIRGHLFLCGVLTGLIFALKLYPAPFLLYFAIRRQWSAVWGMLAAIGILTLAAIGTFGFDDVWYFATAVLPRALDGSVNDPYHPFWGSMTAFLRHTFVREAELNPHPVIDAPALFFFLRSFYTVGVLTLSLLALRRASWDEARAYSWFVIVLFVLSPNTASYHFILLLVPVALFLRRDCLAWSAGLIALYAVIEYPLRSWDAWLFPKAWLLLGLLVYAGWKQLIFVGRKPVFIALLAVVAASALDAMWRWSLYRAESPRTAAHAVIVPHNNIASAAACGSGELVFQAMSEERYVLKEASPAGIRTFAFDGEAFHPTVTTSGRLCYFEMLTHRHSRICSLDLASASLHTVVDAELDPMEPAISADGAKLAFVSAGSLYVQEAGKSRIAFSSRTATGPSFFPDGVRLAFAEGRPGRRSIRSVSLAGGETTVLTEEDTFEPAISPDGKLLAYTKSATASRQVWIRNLESGARWPVTTGLCNNDSPGWRGDSRSIIFSSDCSRGLGLPALYTVSIKR